MSEKFADDREPHSAPRTNDIARRSGLAHQFGSLLGNRIGGSEQHGVSAMHISRGDRPPFVSNERGDRRFGISKVGRERGVAMAQDMWRHVGGQSAKLHDPRPK